MKKWIIQQYAKFQFFIGTASTPSARGNSLSSAASHRSSPFLNTSHPPSKESTINHAAIANLNAQKRSSLESPSAVNRVVAQLTNTHSGSYSSSVNNSSGSPSPVAMMLRNSHPVSSGSIVSSPNSSGFSGTTFVGSIMSQTPQTTSAAASFTLPQALTSIPTGNLLVHSYYLHISIYFKPIE